MRRLGPPRKRSRRTVCVALGILAALFLATGCRTTRLDPIAGADFALDSDERELWTAAERAEKSLSEAKLFDDDPALEAYLQRIAARLLHHLGSTPHPIRIYLVEDPFINAAALPNGAILIHTGVFAGIQDEAQLAMIVGHELAHYVGRHQLRQRRTEANRRDTANVVLGVLAALAVAGGEASLAIDILSKGGRVSTDIVTAQVQGFGRDLESEADRLALTALVGAGYDPRSAMAVFDALDNDRPAGEIAEPYYLGSHPSLAERSASCRALLAELPAVPPSVAPEGDFDAIIAPALLRSAQLDLAIGRSQRAADTLARHLRSLPGSAEGHYTLGLAHQRLGDDAARVAAATDAFREATRLDPNLAAAHRALGLALRDQGDDVGARTPLLRYLDSEPQAADAPIIRSYLGIPP